MRTGRRSKTELLAALGRIPSKTTLFIRPPLLEEIVHEVEKL
jgi:hypothetical protein